MSSESALLSQIFHRVGSRPDCRIWRSQPLAARDRNGRIVRALPKGHPDIAGLIRLLPGVAAPLYVEAKYATGLRPEQRHWRDMLLKFGACYVCAETVEAVEAEIARYCARALETLRG